MHGIKYAIAYDVCFQATLYEIVCIAHCMCRLLNDTYVNWDVTYLPEAQ